MRKLIPVCAFALAFAALCAITLPAPAAKPQADKVESHRDFDAALHKKCLYPTIRISNTEITQKSSGFILRSEKMGDSYANVAMTCAHCINDEDEDYFADIPTYMEDGTTFDKFVRYPVIIYAQNPALDLAVVLFRTPTQMHVVELDFDRKVCIGNKILHFGCGMGEEPRLEWGYINSLKGKVGRHKTDVYRTSVQTIFGDSGGPTFYNNYKCIGINQAIKVTNFRGFPAMLPGISMVIPIGTVKTWDGLENNTLRFLYNQKADLPRLPFAMLVYQPVNWEKIEHEGD